MNVQNMLSHGHTPIWQNFACLYQREKTFSQTQIHVENIILILRSKTKVIQSSWMYATHRTMVIHSCAKQSTVKGPKIWGLNTKQCHKPFDLVVKDQRCIKITNLLNTFSHGDRPMCQIWYDIVRADRSCGHEDTTKYKFDLDVKGQHQIGNMNVRVTSSHGDRPMCQIW